MIIIRSSSEIGSRCSILDILLTRSTKSNSRTNLSLFFEEFGTNVESAQKIEFSSCTYGHSEDEIFILERLVIRGCLLSITTSAIQVN